MCSAAARLARRVEGGLALVPGSRLRRLASESPQPRARVRLREPFRTAPQRRHSPCPPRSALLEALAQLHADVCEAELLVEGARLLARIETHLIAPVATRLLDRRPDEYGSRLHP